MRQCSTRFHLARVKFHIVKSCPDFAMRKGVGPDDGSIVPLKFAPHHTGHRANGNPFTRTAPASGI